MSDLRHLLIVGDDKAASWRYLDISCVTCVRQTDIIYWSDGVSRVTCYCYAMYLVLGFVFVISGEVQRGGNEILGLDEGKGPNAHSAP